MVDASELYLLYSLFFVFNSNLVISSHMTCKKCKHEFCWVCMGPWSEHGTAWYSCNRYDEKTGVDARDAQSKSRASLERYLHVSIEYIHSVCRHELMA